jgi:hypothetical protein
MNPHRGKASEKFRNVVIMIYMVGNTLTFTKLLSTEMAGPKGTGEVGIKVVRALLLSFIWPFYWIGRTVFG